MRGDEPSALSLRLVLVAYETPKINEAVDVQR